MELKHDFFFRVTVTKTISGAGTENEKYGEELIGDYNDEKSAKRKQKELMNDKNYLRYYNNIQIKKIYFDWILYGLEYQPHFDTPSCEEIERGSTEEELRSYLCRYLASPISKKFIHYKIVKADTSGEMMRPIVVIDVKQSIR